MCHHEQKNCPVCGTRFECKAGSIHECQCYEVRLVPEQIQALNEMYSDCLCVQCLCQFQQQGNLSEDEEGKSMNK